MIYCQVTTSTLNKRKGLCCKMADYHYVEDRYVLTKWREAKKRARKHIGNYLLFAIVLYLLLNVIFVPARVQSTSMTPTISEGGRVLASRISVLLGKEIQRGDIVIFKRDSVGVVKRVVAVPGDTVEIVDGVLLVNGEVEDGSYYIGKTNPVKNTKWVIGGTEYFVLGDNREGSYDSRDYGPIDKDTIIAIYLFTYWSGAVIEKVK